MLTDQQFQQTPTYRALCQDYGLDHTLPLDTQLMTAADARAFWNIYHTQRHVLDPATAPQVAAIVEALIRAAEGTQGSLVLIERFGHLIAVQTECGRTWMVTTAETSEQEVAAAMVVKMSGDFQRNLS
jgi:hypothetical protein